jgi:predicted site-specific integrase-resolvase
MPKPQKTPRVSTPDRKGVFGQGAKALRVALYARVSRHDQQTLPMQMSAMRDYAKRRKWAVAIEVKDVGSGATTRPKREKLMSIPVQVGH